MLERLRHIEFRESAARAAGLLLLIAAGMVLGKALSVTGIKGAAGLLALPVAGAFVWLVVKQPRNGLLIALHLGFFVLGLTRYVSGPLGLSMDGILALTLVGAVFSTPRAELAKLRNPVVYVTLIWFAFTVLMLFNPEARSRVAWFYAVRGVSLYAALAIPLILVAFNRKRDLNSFLFIWLGWAVLAAFWGYKQLYIGLDGAERHWLDSGAGIRHILHGRLRVFSFMSDAGQFGAAMAHATVAAGILTVGAKRWRYRFLFGLITLVVFWGLAISGSRGPLIIVFAGVGMYLLVIKNFRVLLLGGMLGVAAFGFLKYTTIAQGNYQVQRMRSALDPNDASFQVRLENQRKLSRYLADKPLGGGIGSGGAWGQRFSPGTFLAETALDSWYVKIWVETGIVGLVLHIGTILFFLFYGGRNVMRLRDPVLRNRMAALYCGYFGVVVGAYGNQIYGQMPTGTLMYFTLAFLFLCPQWDKPVLPEVSAKSTRP